MKTSSFHVKTNENCKNHNENLTENQTENQSENQTEIRWTS